MNKGLATETLTATLLAHPSPSTPSSCTPSPSTPVRHDLAQVYALHFKYVWRCLKSLGVQERHLDDAVQEVFLVVHRKLDSFDGNHALTSWLYAIAVRMARRNHRAAAQERSRFLSEDEASEHSEHSHSSNSPLLLEENERLSLAQQALTSLNESKREVFVLSAIEGLSAPEIAPILGIPLNTVYSRLRAARLAFTNRVQELEQMSHSKRLP
jgi:RNA polymerase sigma-70 factor, ECF subfamily